MKRQQTGQAIVEFALVLPILTMLLLAIIYLSMVFADYLTLSSIARDSARYAAVAADSTTTGEQIRTKYNQNNNPSLISSIYTWNQNDANDFNIAVNQSDGDPDNTYVLVNLRATAANTAVYGNILTLPSELKVSCKMHQEK
ncbi:TadE/TadG family type IV pilus assembly protein [Pectinatus frisingensis]|jgi:Flp pilus assembly protein TadG|uniref:TadE/TadG family type IV pilus assembly protein n=1 Tax=Pectinatus frisingensis TaxID=865 RepID=UPI0015F3E769|nr:TadE/TadG family type IV pilus assembly protein [Pectinatus frisingensis]